MVAMPARPPNQARPIGSSTPGSLVPPPSATSQRSKRPRSLSADPAGESSNKWATGHVSPGVRQLLMYAIDHASEG